MMTDNEQPSSRELSTNPQPENNQQPLRPTIPAVRTSQASARQARPAPPSEGQIPSSGVNGEEAPAIKPSVLEPVGEYYERARDYYNKSPRLQHTVYQGKFAPAFWTVASVISLVVNVILIAVILILGRQLFNLRALISDGLVSGLYENFVKMDQAHIITEINVSSTIQVQDEMAVVFSLPLKQDTGIVLTEATTIDNATIYLNGAAVPIDIILPSGTGLNIGMDMVVPVSTTIPVALDVPVNLTVPVDIPLEQTELHEPFVGLRGVVEPYNLILSDTPTTWEQIEACDHWYSRWVCKIVFGGS